MLGPGNVSDVDLVRINTAVVDFGDLPHTGVGGGEPQGTAAICWGTGMNTVAVVGRGFYDSGISGYEAIVEFEFPPAGGDRQFNIGGKPGAVASSDFRWRQSYPGDVTQVRINLKVATYDQAGIWRGNRVIHTSTYQRGD
jgi:hypothetical protein